MQFIARRFNTFLLVLIALMVASLIAILATRAGAGPLDPPGPPASTSGVLRPGTPITTLPFTISSPGYYFLVKNLTMTGAGDGITISADHVVLDLGGFTLDGNNTGGNGIKQPVSTLTSTIENGHVAHWTSTAVAVSGSEVDHIVASSNQSGIAGTRDTVNDCTVMANTAYGLYLNESTVTGCAVTGNGTGMVIQQGSSASNVIATDNSGDGIYGQSATIADCGTSGNGGAGVNANLSTVTGCSDEGDLFGIVGDDATISGNTIFSSKSDGIRLVGSHGGSLVEDNSVRGCGTGFLASGVWVQTNDNRIVRNTASSCNGDGIGVAGSYNTIDDNSVLENVRWGINAGGILNILVHNMAMANTTGPYQIGLQDQGFNGGNPGSTTSAWANVQ